MFAQLRRYKKLFRGFKTGALSPERGDLRRLTVTNCTNCGHGCTNSCLGASKASVAFPSPISTMVWSQAQLQAGQISGIFDQPLGSDTGCTLAYPSGHLRRPLFRAANNSAVFFFGGEVLLSHSASLGVSPNRYSFP